MAKHLQDVEQVKSQSAGPRTSTDRAAAGTPSQRRYDELGSLGAIKEALTPHTSLEHRAEKAS